MPRIAWFSAISKSLPLKSSHYTSEVFRYVRSQDLGWDIELFVDDEDLRDIEKRSFEGVPLYHYLRAGYRDESSAFDYFVYQFEDHPRATFVQTAASIMPGISFFHDLNLSRLEYSRVEHSSTGAALNDKIEETYGDDAVKLGDLKARGWSIEVFDKAYPQGEEALRASAVIAVSNIRAVQELEARDMKIPISMTGIPKANCAQQATHYRALRTELGLSDKTPLISFAGEQMLEDRALLSLEAFSQLLKRLQEKPLATTSWDDLPRLLWVSADEPSQQKAKLILDSFLEAHEDCAEHIFLVNSESFEAYQNLLSVADVFIGLKFDALRGRTTALTTSLSCGIPSVVSEFGPSAELPLSAAARVPVGRGERELLTRTLEELLRRKPLREYYSQGALEYSALVCDAGAVTADLEALFKRHEIRLHELGRLARNRFAKRHLDLVRELEQGTGADPVLQAIGEAPVFSASGAGIAVAAESRFRAAHDFQWIPEALPSRLARSEG